ncbi:hypothetical protein [Roseovarius indicus]|uniref:hypothetical protein n=1 Tax=Roseovarius indicus TaxID=540747 RepID=UPI00405809D7
MNIEIAARKAKRRAKTQAWRERTGKQKPMKGEAFLDGRRIGNAGRVDISKEGGAA